MRSSLNRAGVAALAVVAIVTGSASVAAAQRPCTASAADDARKRFKQLFDAQRHAEAFDALSWVEQSCRTVLSGEEQAWVWSDLALTARKLGTDARCLEILERAHQTDPGSKAGKALLYNRGLCGGECPSPSIPVSLSCFAGRSARFAHLTSPLGARLVRPGDAVEVWVAVPGSTYFPDYVRVHTPRARGEVWRGATSLIPGAGTAGAVGEARLTASRRDAVSGSYSAPWLAEPGQREFTASACTVDPHHPDAAPAAATFPVGLHEVDLHLTVRTADGCLASFLLVYGTADPVLGPREYTQRDGLWAHLFPGPRCSLPEGGLAYSMEAQPGPYREPGPHLLLTRTSPDLEGSYELPLEGGRRITGTFQVPLCDLAGMMFAKPASELPRAEASGPCSPGALEALSKDLEATIERDPKRAYRRIAERGRRCEGRLMPAERLTLAVLLANAARAMGDEKACIAAIDAAPRDLASSDEGAGHLLGLCGGGCNIHTDPGCLDGKSERYQSIMEEANETGFGAPPCPIPGWKDALAVAPRGAGAACVQLVGPSSEDLSAPDPATGVLVRWSCPRLLLIEQRGTEVRTRAVQFGGAARDIGRISDPADCCNFGTLEVKDEKSATLVRVRGEGRNCFGGTASWIYDEIFRWDGGELTFQRDHDFAMH